MMGKIMVHFIGMEIEFIITKYKEICFSLEKGGMSG